METPAHASFASRLIPACLAGLATFSLAFTLTPAPAAALSVDDGSFLTGATGTSGSAVARIEIPHIIKGKNGKEDEVGYSVCAGALIGPAAVVTSNTCLTSSGSPYQDVYQGTKQLHEIGGRAARVTFGGSAASGKDVYWSLGVEAENPRTGLAVVNLDRVVTGVTPLRAPTKTARAQESVYVYGWADAITPLLGSTAKKIDKPSIAYISGKRVEVASMDWEQFLKDNKKIPSGIITGTKRNDEIVPAFRINGINVGLEDMGTPVIDSSGAVRGILVGTDANAYHEATFVDLGTTDMHNLVFRNRPAPQETKIEEAKDLPKLYEQLGKLQRLVCASPSSNSGLTKPYAYDGTPNSVQQPLPAELKEGLAHGIDALPDYKDEEVKPSGSSISWLLVDKMSDPTIEDPYTSVCGTGTDLENIVQKAKTGYASYSADSQKLQDDLIDAQSLLETQNGEVLEAQAEFDAAQVARDAAPGNTNLSAAYAAAKEKLQKAKEAQNAAQAQVEDIQLRSELYTSLNGAIRDLLNSVLEDFAWAKKQVADVQTIWQKTDDKYSQDYQKAKTAFLDAKQKKEEIEQKNDAITAENATKCVKPGAMPGSCKKYEAGYPKALLPVPPLPEDPARAYAAGKLSHGVDRTAEKTALNAALNELLPRFLNARHKAYTLKQIAERLRVDSTKPDPQVLTKLRLEIAAMLKEARDLGNKIIQNYDKYNRAHSELKNLVDTLPDTLKPSGNTLLESLQQPLASARLATETVRDSNEILDKVQDKMLDDDIKLYQLKDLQKQVKGARNSVKGAYDSTANVEKQVNEALFQAKLLKDGLLAPSEGKLTPEQQARKQKEENERKAAEKAAAEAKAKQEAEAKKKAEEAAKKQAEEQAKKKAEAEAKKKETAEKDKKDEARLAKAISMNTKRADGANRTLTSIAAWKMGHFPGDTVIVVDGMNHADGVSVTPLAGALQAPVLLTTWKTGLEPAIVDQLKVSGKKHVLLVGGQVNVSPYDEFELNQAGIDVSRIAGPNRYSTAVAANRRAAELYGAKPGQPLDVFLGDGVGFPDALAAGAAGGRQRGIALLTQGDQIPAEVRDFMVELGSSRPLRVNAVGGPAVRAFENTPWPATLSVKLNPIMGRDRYNTATALAANLPGTEAAILASGETFADSLSGGALAVDQNAALILTKTQELPAVSVQGLRRHGAKRTIVIGGEKAVSRKVAEQVNGAAIDKNKTVRVDGTLAELKKMEEEQASKVQALKNQALDQLRQELLRRAKKDPASVTSWLGDTLGIADPNNLAKLLQPEVKKDASQKTTDK